MVYRTLTILTALILVLAVSAFAQDPGVPDSLRIDSVKVDPGEQAVVDVTFFNDEELQSYQVPFKWSGDDITLDSISFVGSRVNYIATRIVTINNPNQEALTVLILVFETELPPGDGLYCRMYFDIPPGTPDQRVYIDTTLFDGIEDLYFIVDEALNFAPVVKRGQIVIGNPVEPPTIGVSATEFNFEAEAGGETAPGQALTITNEGAGTLQWTATWNESWLSVLPAFGSVFAGGFQHIQISANTTALAPGMYNDVITISDPAATNDPVEIQVHYNVTVPPPVIGYSPSQFIFNAVASGSNPDDQFLEITNEGSGVLEWIVSKDSAWLSLDPVSGTDDGTVTVSIDITGLPYGEYRDTILISDPDATNSPRKVPVRLNISSDLPIIDVDTSFFFINVVDPVFTPGRTFTILNAGGGSMNYTLSENSPRITSLTPSSGAVPQQVAVGFKTSGGSPGDEFEDTVWVSSAEAINSPQPVVFHFLYTSNPDNIVVNVFPITATYYECGQGTGGGLEMLPTNITITNGALRPMDFSLSWNSEWFELDATSGTTPAILTPTFNHCRIEPGVYEDTLVIFAVTAINSPRRIPIVMTILPTVETPELVVGEDSLHFFARENQESRFSLFTINNANPGCMEWQMTENIPWLISGIDSSGCKIYPWYVSVHCDATGLSFGRYTDNITITAPGATGSPVVIPTVLDVWKYYGDVDWNGIINILDIVYLIEYLFKDRAEPLPFKLIGDTDCNFHVNLLDVIEIIDYKFKNGPPLCGNETK